MQDPYKIPRPHLAPQRAPCYQAARGAGRLAPVHTHRAFVQADGSGVTDISVSHFHRIRDWRILPDASDSHVHGITRIPCGYGI